MGGVLPTFVEACSQAGKVESSGVDSCEAFRTLLARLVIADCVVRLALSAGLMKESAAGRVFYPTKEKV